MHYCRRWFQAKPRPKETQTKGFNVSQDPTKHSFSVAFGYADLPQQMKLGELPQEARIGLWNAFFSTFQERYSTLRGMDYEWEEILTAAHADHFNLALDTFTIQPEHILGFYKRHFLEAEINGVFDLILFLARKDQCPYDFLLMVKRVFVNHRLAYVFDTNTRTIFQAYTPEEGQAMVAAVNALVNEGLNGAGRHLIQAADFANEGRWERSVHESISAVESVACQIEPKSNTLGAALKKLEKQGLLAHPALNQGFGKLYGYTSNEQGVRHALLDQGQSNVGQDEAVFMLGACASFASYLWRKHLASGSTS